MVGESGIQARDVRGGRRRIPAHLAREVCSHARPSAPLAWVPPCTSLAQLSLPGGFSHRLGGHLGCSPEFTRGSEMRP